MHALGAKFAKVFASFFKKKRFLSSNTQAAGNITVGLGKNLGGSGVMLSASVHTQR
jgi:hypothetical protein